MTEETDIHSYGETALEQVGQGVPDIPDEHVDIPYEDFLSMLMEDPKIERDADKRFYDMIMSHGTSELPEEQKQLYVGDRDKDDLQRYHFFDDPFSRKGEDAIYGIDGTLNELMSLAEGAARGDGPNERINVWHGPVATAKSTAGTLVRQGAVAYSKTPEGRMYTFKWDLTDPETGEPLEAEDGELFPEEAANDYLVDCPIHNHPLAVLPEENDGQHASPRERVIEDANRRFQALRSMDEEELENTVPGFYLEEILDGAADPDDFTMEHYARMPYNEVSVEGPACGQCTFYREALMNYYQQEEGMEKGEALQQTLNHVLVNRLVLDEQNRVGIGTFQPKEPKSQDATELTGGINWSDVQVYGSESDPRAFSWEDGELVVANRGIFDGEELFKLKKDFLYDFLHASQEGEITPSKSARVPYDGVIIGRTNKPEFDDFLNDENEVALHDRISRTDWGYALRYDDEKDIYEKKFGDADVHIAPHTLEMAALFATMSRLSTVTGDQDIDRLTKAKAYNGDDLAKTEVDVEELREAAVEAAGSIDELEGMDGISPRFMFDRISTTISEADEDCVNPYLALNIIEDNISHEIKEDDKVEEYMGHLTRIVEDEFPSRAKEDVRKAFTYNEDKARELADEYVDNVMAYNRGEKIEDAMTGRKKDPNESLMRDIEDALDIPRTQKDDFRQSVSNWISGRARDGATIDPLDMDDLSRAVEEYMWEKHKDEINFNAWVADKSTEDHQNRRNELMDSLQEDFDYCDTCAERTVDHVAAEVAQDEIVDE
jgi:serine protein kinase